MNHDLILARSDFFFSLVKFCGNLRLKLNRMKAMKTIHLHIWIRNAKWTCDASTLIQFSEIVIEWKISIKDWNEVSIKESNFLELEWRYIFSWFSDNSKLIVRESTVARCRFVDLMALKIYHSNKTCTELGHLLLASLEFISCELHLRECVRAFVTVGVVTY